MAGQLSPLHFLFLTFRIPFRRVLIPRSRHPPPQQPFEAFLPFLKQVTEFLEKLLTWPRSKFNGIFFCRIWVFGLAVPTMCHASISWNRLSHTFALYFLPLLPSSSQPAARPLLTAANRSLPPCKHGSDNLNPCLWRTFYNVDIEK